MQATLRKQLNELTAPITYKHPLKVYLDANYTYLSQGSDRMVWRISKRRVLKVAKTTRGVSQLANEARVDGAYYKAVVAQVIEAHKYWLIMEYADTSDPATQAHEELVHQLIDNYELVDGDVWFHGHWGRIGKRVVLVDYGFTYDLVDGPYDSDSEDT
jgi:hypothetical protein